MTFKRLVSMLLCFIIAALFLSSCTDGDKKPDSQTTPKVSDTSESQPETTENLYDEDGYLLDELPDDLRFENKEFRLFTWSNQTVWEWDSEAFTGELLKDSIYNRKLAVEDRLGITLVITKQPGEWENRNSFIQTVSNNVLAGSGAYDLIGQYTPAAAIGAMKELYVDLKEVEYIDFDKPWWPGDITTSSSINGKLYFTTGDITPTLIRNMGTVMGNLDLIDAYGLGDVYSLVDSGAWTLEKLRETAVGIVGDPNGQQQPYGLTITSNVLFDNLFYAGGFKFVDANSDGTIKLSDSISGEKMINWFKSCQNLFTEHSDVTILAINSGFTSGGSIFHMGQISDVQNFLKDTTMHFAILPYPKYDTAQENYHTIVGYWVSMYSIPIDAPNASMSGAVLEALCSAAYRQITPAFYREAFQYRYLDTEVNARMFDLLHDTLVYDTGRTFCDQISIFSAFRTAATRGNEWSSHLASNKAVWGKMIEKIYTTLG